MEPRQTNVTLLDGVSVVVPVFQSELTLADLVGRVRTTLKRNFEVILVDDGSPPHVWAEILRLCGDGVRGIRLSRNFGQHAAVLAGVRDARFRTVVTMDDDLQSPPEEIPKLLEALTVDLDVIYGRKMRMSHSATRRILSTVGLRLISWLASDVAPFQMTSFRAFRTALREAFNDYDGPDASFDALLSWSSARYKIVDTDHAPRQIGKSNYTYRKLIQVFFRELFTYSTTPLKVATAFGLAVVVLSGGSLVYVLAVTIFASNTVAGFGFVASFLAIIAGSQIMFLGLIGQYVGQIHQRVLGKPTYVIAEFAGGASLPTKHP